MNASAPTDGLVWEKEGRGDCNQLVAQGGSWGDKAVNSRSSDSVGMNSFNRNNFIGFRLAQDLD